MENREEGYNNMDNLFSTKNKRFHKTIDTFITI